MPAATVRLKQLDGFWQTVGVDTYRGVHADNLVLSADMFGSKTASFDLRRDPAVVYQDLSAFTPVKVDVDGVPSWSGRMIETPSRDGTEQAMSVQCEGWQHHLDDDLYERKYVHTRLADFVDTRSFLGAPLGNFKAAGVVTGGQGIMLGWPKGYAVVAGDCVGVTFDYGPGSLGVEEASVSFTDSTFAAGAFTLYIKAHDTMAGIITTGTNYNSVDAATNTKLLRGNSIGTRYRYISVFIYCTVGGTVTADRQLRITDYSSASDANYTATGVSSLTASTVVTDALSQAAPLLSTDTSGITATSFFVPEYAPDDPRTPREHINSVNAFHGYQFKVDPEKRPIFRALPSRPKFTVGDWSACELQDSSQNSGQEVYNRVIATATDPAGQKVIVYRNAAQASGGTVPVSRMAPFSNPSFDTNTTGWSASATGGSITLTRDTVNYGTTPAAMKIDAGVAAPTSGSVSTTLSGTFTAGFSYLFTFWMKVGGVSFAATPFQVKIGSTVITTLSPAASSTTTVTATFSPSATVTNPVFALSWAGKLPDSGVLYVDSFQADQVIGALPDRRGFLRTKQVQIGATMPSDGVAAAAIADVWLSSHYQTPFRGTLTITGPNALRDRTSGTPIPPAALLRETGELIHFADRIDPDTGGVGRDGRIVSVTYRPDLDQAVIELDNSRADFDQLMSRLAVIQDAGR